MDGREMNHELVLTLAQYEALTPMEKSMAERLPKLERWHGITVSAPALHELLATIADLRIASAELRHDLDGDWKCDRCGYWFSVDIPKVGHECYLCERCASVLRKKAD